MSNFYIMCGLAFSGKSTLARKIAKDLGVNPIVIYLNTPMEFIREREFTNKTTGERHEVEPDNFRKVVEQLEVPTSNESVLEFTPNHRYGEIS